MFKATSSLSVQIHFFIWCPESLHHPFRHLVSCFVSFWLLEPSSHLRSAFRAITSQYRCSDPSSSHSRFWRSEPSSHLRSAFRAMFCFIRHLELYLRSAFGSTSSFGVQSHCISFVSTFRATSSFCVQDHYLFISVLSRGFSSTLRVFMYISHSIHHHFPPF